jgi:hypothetical protein
MSCDGPSATPRVLRFYNPTEAEKWAIEVGAWKGEPHSRPFHDKVPASKWPCSQHQSLFATRIHGFTREWCQRATVPTHAHPYTVVHEGAGPSMLKCYENNDVFAHHIKSGKRPMQQCTMVSICNSA